jgi:hypothetical protein
MPKIKSAAFCACDAAFSSKVLSFLRAFSQPLMYAALLVCVVCSMPVDAHRKAAVNSAVSSSCE